jgi:hypothetical protein
MSHANHSWDAKVMNYIISFVILEELLDLAMCPGAKG